MTTNHRVNSMTSNHSQSKDAWLTRAKPARALHVPPRRVCCFLPTARHPHVQIPHIAATRSTQLSLPSATPSARSSQRSAAGPPLPSAAAAALFDSAQPRYRSLMSAFWLAGVDWPLRAARVPRLCRLGRWRALGRPAARGCRPVP